VRRRSIVQLLLLGLLFGAAAGAVALFIPWLPPSDAKEADRIHFVFWFTTVICVAIFALVAAVIVYSVIKFRAAPDDDSDGAPIHGHTGLEIVWTAFPAALVTAISIVSAVVLAQNGNAGSDKLIVNVTAQQFAWSFQYPQYDNLTSGELHLPRDRPVELMITSKDVIHSFWVPQFSQKQDAVPGAVNKLVITPTKNGVYPVICTELCGLGHAVMRSEAIVVDRTAFSGWVKQQQQAAKAGPGQAGLAVYNSNGCGSCHMLAAAKSTGKVGPDLDKLPADAQKAGKPLEDYTRESIVSPNAYIVPGFNANVMPATFSSLPKDQLDSLVSFLVKSSQKGS
jgi:cytochrome c oxidase subunit 2